MSLCNQQSNSNSSNSTSSSSNGKVQSSHTRSSSSQSSSHPQQQQQQQQTHHQKPVATPNKSNTTPKTPSSSSSQTSVTNVNFTQTSSLTNNVLPTATLDLRYFNQKLNTRAFFNMGSQRSFISPEIVCRLKLPVIEQVPIQLSTFGNDSTSCLLDLVKVKVQFGKQCFPVKLLVAYTIKLLWN